MHQKCYKLTYTYHLIMIYHAFATFASICAMPRVVDFLLGCLHEPQSVVKPRIQGTPVMRTAVVCRQWDATQRYSPEDALQQVRWPRF